MSSFLPSFIDAADAPLSAQARSLVLSPLDAAPAVTVRAADPGAPIADSAWRGFLRNPAASVRSLLTDEMPVPGPIEERRKGYNSLQKFLRYAGFPLIMGGATVAGWQLMEHGMSPGVATTVTTLGSIGLTALMERIIPFRKDWQAVPRDLWLDGAHNLLSTAGFVQLVKHYLAAPVVLGASVFAAQQLGGLESVQAFGESARALLPFSTDIATWHPLALFAAFLIPTEALTYLAHRAVHEIPAGWYLHRIHHRPDKMNALKGGFNNMWDSLKELSHFALPLSAMILLSGDSPDALDACYKATALIVAMTTAKGFLQHSNADLTLKYKVKVLGKELTFNGEYVISGVQAHRWHHARDEKHNTNYGINLMVFDTASAVPEWTLDALVGAVPQAAQWPGMTQARGAAKYMNSLYLPEKEAPDEVGIDAREEKRVVRYPVRPDMGFTEVTINSWKQFVVDNLKPLRDIWRGGLKSFIPISPTRASVEPDDTKAAA